MIEILIGWANIFIFMSCSFIATVVCISMAFGAIWLWLSTITYLCAKILNNL